MNKTTSIGYHKIAAKNPTAYIDTLMYYKQSGWNLEAAVKYYNDHWADKVPAGEWTIRGMLKDFRNDAVAKLKDEMMDYLTEDILGSITTRKAQNLSYKCLQRLENYVDKHGDDIDVNVLTDIIKASKIHQETAIRQQVLDEQQTLKIEQEQETGNKVGKLSLRELYDVGRTKPARDMRSKIIETAGDEVFGDGDDNKSDKEGKD